MASSSPSPSPLVSMTPLKASQSSIGLSLSPTLCLSVRPSVRLSVCLRRRHLNRPSLLLSSRRLSAPPSSIERASGGRREIKRERERERERRMRSAATGNIPCTRIRPKERHAKRCMRRRMNGRRKCDAMPAAAPPRRRAAADAAAIGAGY